MGRNGFQRGRVCQGFGSHIPKTSPRTYRCCSYSSWVLWHRPCGYLGIARRVPLRRFWSSRYSASPVMFLVILGAGSHSSPILRSPEAPEPATQALRLQRGSHPKLNPESQRSPKELCARHQNFDLTSSSQLDTLAAREVFTGFFWNAACCFLRFMVQGFWACAAAEIGGQFWAFSGTLHPPKPESKKACFLLEKDELVGMLPQCETMKRR